MKKHYLKYFIAAVAIILLLFVSRWSTEKKYDETSPSAIEEEKAVLNGNFEENERVNENNNPDKEKEQVLVVGTSADYPPFEFLNNDKEIVGFDLDLIRAIAEKLNMNVKIENMSFNSLILSLSTNKIDVIAAGLSKTEEREKKIDFSDPYYHNFFALLVDAKRSDIDYANPLKKGLKVGAQTGSQMYSWAKQNPDLDVMTVDSNLMLVQLLKTGNLDAVIVDKEIAISFEKTDKSLMVIDLKDKSGNQISGGEGMSFGLKKKSDLLQGINKAIAELKTSGEIEKLRSKWGL